MRWLPTDLGGRVRVAARSRALHFVALGALLLIADRAWRAREGGDKESILLVREDVERLRREWTAGHGAPPTAAEETGLLENLADEQILEREALRLALDRDDRLVRDRMVKLGRFLDLADGAGDEDVERASRELRLESEDPVVRRYLAHLMQIALAGPGIPPSADEVRQRYERVSAALRPAERVRLVHVYLSRDRRGESAARDADAILAQLRARGDGPDGALGLGDPFATGSRFGPATMAEVERDFGAAFAAAVAIAPAGEWHGPIASSYGLHLVWIRDRLAGRVPDLDSVRNQIAHDLMRERQEQRLRERLALLRRQYRIEVRS